jgi:tripartite-type tricarboxylate transporter receptor subunit TctC
MKKLLVLAIAVLAIGTAVSAQARFPAKDITITVVFSAGGGTDVLNRLIAGEMRPFLGRNVVVTNVTGGVSASNGMFHVWGLPHDGYNLAGLSESVVSGPVMGGFDKRMNAWYPFLIAGSPDVVSVPASSPYKTLKELVDAATAKPGTVKAGCGNVGGLHHLNMLAFENGTGVKFNYIPYPGSGPSQTAAVTGEIDVVFTSLAEQQQLIKAGQLRALGMLTEKPFALEGYGEISSSFKGYANLKKYLPIMQAIGFAMPGDVPADARKAIETAFNKAMKSKKVVEYMANNYYQPIGKSGKDALAIFDKLESLFSWTLFELGQAKVDPSTVGISKP